MIATATSTLLTDALRCRNGEKRPPIWLMRQAGRYLPEYRALREKYPFLTMCHAPEIAKEVTLMPIKRFGMDGAILFSDILVIPEALERGLRFEEEKGPIIEKPLKGPKDIEALPPLEVEEKLSYVAETIRLLKGERELNVPLIGFSGAPFTLASYMIEGGSSRTLALTKRWMFEEPNSFHRLLTLLRDAVVSYLDMQIDAGVDALQLFDSWANVLSHSHFKEFSLKYMQSIVERVKDKSIPTILFCRGAGAFAPSMAKAKPSAISVDWNGDLPYLRKQIPKNIALQGNLDPDLLKAPKETLKREAAHLLSSMNGDPSYIFNLGHGITPDVDPESVKLLVDTVKGWNAENITSL